MPSPTVVLVHGGWGGAWCWTYVGEELDRAGIDWRAIDLPSSQKSATATSDLYDDARAVVQACSLAGPVLLVGHSYAGAVITEAAPQVRTLVRLVYVAALVPALGESATSASRVVRAPTELDDAIEVDGDFLRLNPELAASALYGQSAPEMQKWAISKLSTQTLASFRSKRTAIDVASPSVYVKCRSDHAIDPLVQEAMASRCSESVELESDHSPFLSHPLKLARALLDSL